MKDHYDFKKLKRRPVNPNAPLADTKTPISIRIDTMDLVELKTEAYEMGVPYQTWICSILHRYAMGESVQIRKASAQPDKHPQTPRRLKPD